MNLFVARLCLAAVTGSDPMSAGLRTDTGLSRTWPGMPGYVRLARRWLYGQLYAENGEVRHKAVTIASEFITNALEHTCSGQPGGRFTLRVDTDHEDGVWISVTDEGSADMPIAADLKADLMAVLATDDLPENGMGIALLVTGLSSAWGHEPSGRGRTTWAIVPH